MQLHQSADDRRRSAPMDEGQLEKCLTLVEPITELDRLLRGPGRALHHDPGKPGLGSMLRL